MNASRLITIVFLVAGAIGTARGQQATFSSRIDAVRVDVLVTDASGPIRGLGPSDFEIRDNGVLQQIDLVSFEQIPLNVVLALDMSDSVAGDRLDRLPRRRRDRDGSRSAGDVLESDRRCAGGRPRHRRQRSDTRSRPVRLRDP